MYGRSVKLVPVKVEGSGSFADGYKHRSVLRLFVRRLLWEPRRSSLFNSCGAGARAGRRLYEGTSVIMRPMRKPPGQM